MLMSAFAWIETFYYIDPVKCAKDEDYASKALEIHGAVVPLVLRNQYTVHINDDKDREAILR